MAKKNLLKSSNLLLFALWTSQALGFMYETDISSENNAKVVFTIADGSSVTCNGSLQMQDQLLVEENCAEKIHSKQLLSIQLPQTANPTNSQAMLEQSSATFSSNYGYQFQCDGHWITNEIFIIDQICFDEIKGHSFSMIELPLQSQQTSFKLRLPYYPLYISHGNRTIFCNAYLGAITALLFSFISSFLYTHDQVTNL